MKIIAIKYGETLFGEWDMFKGGSKDVLLPISFIVYLIQTEGKNILVDAGMDAPGGFNMPIFIAPNLILEDIGISPEDITDVVITHAHGDHVEGVWHYKNATVHIQKDEYKKSGNFIPNEFKVNTFEDEFILTNRVVIKKIGGHSIGSCIVLADNYVFCGDECYMKKSLTDNIMTGATCCEENSQAFLDTYSDKRYVPLLAHDPEIMKNEVGYRVVVNEKF